jgi:hypothetical protein
VVWPQRNEESLRMITIRWQSQSSASRSCLDGSRTLLAVTGHPRRADITPKHN